MNKILIIILFILSSTNSFADKKFEKDLKKISKDSAFIDNAGKIYSVDKIDNKATSTENSGGQCFGPMNVSLATGIGNSFLMLAPVFFLVGYVRTVKKKKRSN